MNFVSLFSTCKWVGYLKSYILLLLYLVFWKSVIITYSLNLIIIFYQKVKHSSNWGTILKKSFLTLFYTYNPNNILIHTYIIYKHIPI